VSQASNIEFRYPPNSDSLPLSFLQCSMLLSRFEQQPPLPPPAPLFSLMSLDYKQQNKYPPSHYIRRCPQRKIHQFTFLQLSQLAVMCLFGFSPVTVVEMFFPVFILLMIPFRHKIVPKFVEQKYLEALDGKY
jgi:hypothetical protein